MDDLTSTLQVIVRDARGQVDSNPNVVTCCHQIGFENRNVADGCSEATAQTSATTMMKSATPGAAQPGLGRVLGATALYYVTLKETAPGCPKRLVILSEAKDLPDRSGGSSKLSGAQPGSE